jgi:hypothetical protein
LIVDDKPQPDKLDSGDDTANTADTNDLPDQSNDQQWHNASTSATPDICCYGRIHKPTQRMQES